jgi:uncharacterized membrane protein
MVTLQTCLMQLLYLLMAFVIGVVYGPALETISFGIWPMYLWLITQDAVRDPNKP